MSNRLLLVEDETIIGQVVKTNLERRGFIVDWAENGASAMKRLSSSYYDLIVLDLMLPDMNGMEIVRWLRRERATLPILMLTARSDTDSKVKGLENGADDYLTKPFEMEELAARLAALLRRSRSERHLPSGTTYRFPNGTEVNFETCRISGPRGEAVLKEKESGILQLLVRRKGTIVTRSEILEEVWGMDAFPTERTVDNFIVALRRLIENDPAAPRFLLSVRGRGYRLEDAPEADGD